MGAMQAMEQDDSLTSETAEVIDFPEARAPQLEDGYIRIANELFAALMRYKFSERQLVVLLAILRKTYGYGKKEDDISASRIGEMCGIVRNHVTATLKELRIAKVVNCRRGEYGMVVSINKNYQQWGVPLRGENRVHKYPVCPEGVLVEELVPDEDTSTSNVFSLVPNTVKGSTEEVHNKRQLRQKTTKTKENISLTLRARFDRFWAAYPKKKSKVQAEKAFAKLNPDEQLLEAILAGLQRAMKSAQWQDVTYIPYPATWLNAGGWMDEIQTEYTPEEREVIDAYNEALGDVAPPVDPEFFVESRASAIRTFRGARPHDPSFWERYFPWVRRTVELPPRTGFDWLISPEGFMKVTSGQFNREGR